VDTDRFTYRVTSGWLRDLASDPTPGDSWPCIRWDEKLLEDQIRFLEVQAELGVEYNLAWGFWIDRAWPVPFEKVIDEARAERFRAFVAAAHARKIKVLSGLGIYSWGFDEVIRKVPGVAHGHAHAMCAFSEEAWDWQRRVLDFVMDPQWGIDGISMQSADQGRCECARCVRLPSAEHHARILVRSAEYVRASRPDWTIGQACWGLSVENPEIWEHLERISRAVDYVIEVREKTTETGRRAALVRRLSCAFGSVGGVFVEPPQHWERRRWCVPCGLSSARYLKKLWQDGGTACEYFYRPFANPVEEVSWRTGARVLSAPETGAEDALREAVAAVYGTSGSATEQLVEWFARGEEAYFSRSSFQVGSGSLSLEPLIWEEDPAAPGPAVYLRDRMAPTARAEYAAELERLKEELDGIDIPDREAARRTSGAIDGTLRDIAALNAAV